MALKDARRAFISLSPEHQFSLLKHPPARARAKKDCMVCMEAIPIGSIIYAQKGCKLVMCQDCTTEMCRTRTRSSGSDGNSNGELMCKECIPSHSIAPSTIARVVPSTVFQGLQASGSVAGSSCDGQSSLIHFCVQHGICAQLKP
eukprot:scaffold152420_cov17-Tisochrysis_lutea.AAC.1